MSDIDAFNKMLPQNPERAWRDVPGYEGHYMVSDDGHVGSVSRRCSTGLGRTRLVRARILQPIVRKQAGRVWSMLVHLCKEDEPTITANIGRIVLIAFRGHVEGHIASYRDGDPTNNRLNNMHWTTFSAIAEAAPNGYAEIFRDPVVRAKQIEARRLNLQGGAA